MDKTQTRTALVEHELKTWPEYFRALADGSKTFEIRKDDRGFDVGHRLRLREWSPHSGGRYTGREEHRTITYVLRGFGAVEAGYVVLGLAAIDAAPPSLPNVTVNIERLRARLREMAQEQHTRQQAVYGAADIRDAVEREDVLLSAAAALPCPCFDCNAGAYAKPSLPTAREVLELIRDADLDAQRMANVLYNLPHRVQADGSAMLTGHDQDQLRDARLAWESSSREMRKALADLSSQEPPSEGWEPTEQPVDRLGQGRLMLNAYGRRCWEAGRASATPEPPSPPPALALGQEWVSRVTTSDADEVPVMGGQSSPPPALDGYRLLRRFVERVARSEMVNTGTTLYEFRRDAQALMLDIAKAERNPR